MLEAISVLTAAADPCIRVNRRCLAEVARGVLGVSIFVDRARLYEVSECVSS